MQIGNKKYYNKKPKGWNPCILGNEKHRDKELNVLPNCVGWATGRFNELGNYGECKYLGNANAEDFIKFVKTQNLELNQKPQAGACMVWEGKGSNAGHVAIVEEVFNENKVTTSESGWNATKSYWTETRTKGTNKNWGSNKNLIFKGFIYNPALPKLIIIPAKGCFKKGDKGVDIEKIDQWLYEKYGDPKVKGALFGENTKKYVKIFQKEAKDKGTYVGIKATIDGKIGILTLKAMRLDGFPY